ncbi:MAG: amidohydrolase family protein [Pirellulaceae bacterium]
MIKIDTHHHFWNFDPRQYAWISEKMTPLRRDFGPGELQEALDAGGISAAISVQARQTVEETQWLLDFAQRYRAKGLGGEKRKPANQEPACLAGVVGWVPLLSDRVDDVLEPLHQNELLRGVRHVVHDEPDDRFLLREDFNRGIDRLQGYGLAYDILIFGKHLPVTIEFVDRHPNQTFILDHIAKPTIKAGSFDTRWAEGIRELAKRNHVWCKFSGVVTEVRDESWDIETIRPYWETSLEAFSAERLMFGSDWPVCLLRSSYQRWCETVDELASELSSEEQLKFWSSNAMQAYGLVL